MEKGDTIMKKSLTKPLLAIIAVNFLWGLDFIVIEYMMHYVSPAVFTMSRLVIGTVILMAISEEDLSI